MEKPLTMTTLLQRLLTEERRGESDPQKHHLAGFRICEKLRQPLCAFAGVAGFRALLSRALTLAKAQAPLLDGVQINPDGTLLLSPELEARLASDDGTRAGVALADQLLGLLITFIGETLTLRLLHNVWPDATDAGPKLKGNHS